jgi:hypothetical protein
MSNKKEKNQEEPQKRVLAETFTCVKIAKTVYDLIMMILKRKKDKDQKEADRITDELIDGYNKIDSNADDKKDKEDIEDVKNDLNNIF